MSLFNLFTKPSKEPKWEIIRPGILALQGARIAIVYEESSQYQFHVHRFSPDFSKELACFGGAPLLAQAQTLGIMRYQELLLMGIEDP